MIKHAFFVRLEAKPGKEQAVADFLTAGLDMTNRETTTPIWFALKLSPTTFGVFDAFASEEDRKGTPAGQYGRCPDGARRRDAGKPPVDRANRRPGHEESAALSRSRLGSAQILTPETYLGQPWRPSVSGVAIQLHLCRWSNSCRFITN
jgi:hypothetical protein